MSGYQVRPTLQLVLYIPPKKLLWAIRKGPRMNACSPDFTNTRYQPSGQNPPAKKQLIKTDDTSDKSGKYGPKPCKGRQQEEVQEGARTEKEKRGKKTRR
jgi:hypothetical protein